MNRYFLDSSALINRYVEEPGTAWIREIAASTSGHGLFIAQIAQIAQVEMVSGIMRRAREGLLGDRAARDLRVLIDRDAKRQYQIVGTSADVIRRAEDLLERYALRASDAIQLASALESSELLADDRSLDLEFVSADSRLLAAAADEGLTIIDPNTRF